VPTSTPAQSTPAQPAPAQEPDAAARRTPGRVPRVTLALGVGVAVLLLIALTLGLATASPVGVEDNGDGYRLTCGAGLAPATVDGLASWKGGVVGDFTRTAACPDRQPSSAWVVLKASTVGHPLTWSLTTLGWWYAGLVGIVGALTAWAASARGLRRAAVVAVPLTPLAVPAFSRFFVSTYGEPAGLLGTAAAVCGVAGLLVTRPADRSARGVALALLAGGGLVAGTAKLAYLPVLAVALVVCAVVAVGRGRGRRVAGPAVALVTAAAVVAPLGVAAGRQDAQYASVNTHDVVFTMALRELGPVALGPLGLPPEARAVIGNGYFNGPPRPEADWWRRAVLDEPGTTRRAAYVELAAHPAAALRALGTGLEATARADLPYLASGPADPAVVSPPSGDVGWSGAQQPQLDRVLDATRRPTWVPAVVVLLALATAVAAGLRAVRRRRPGFARWGAGAGIAAGTALALVAVAVFGDGYFEVFKHVWLAAYLLAVSALCLVGAAVGGVVRPASAYSSVTAGSAGAARGGSGPRRAAGARASRISER